MTLRLKVYGLLIMCVWSAAGGGWIVNKVHDLRGPVVINRVEYKENPLVSEAEKYRPIMEQLLSNRDRAGMASAPVGIVRSPDVIRDLPPLPRRRPDMGRSIEETIELAEAGL